MPVMVMMEVFNNNNIQGDIDQNPNLYIEQFYFGFAWVTAQIHFCVDIQSTSRLNPKKFKENF